MEKQTRLFGAVSLALLLGARAAAAGECAPARITGDPTTLPPAWRAALEALVAATAREGQPWSCPGARVSVVPPGDRGLAQLEVEDSSGLHRRPVASPADVVPLGEAMLASAVVPEPPANPPPPTVVPPPDAPALPPDAARDQGPAGAKLPSHGPSLLVDALLGARYTGPTRAVLLGPELRATFLFDRWSAGLLARYDSAIATCQHVPDQFSLSSVSVGLSGGYRMLAKPVELTADVEPTLAVVFMGAQRPGQMEPDVDAHVDMRLGARFGGAVPVRGRLRFTWALGAEGAPAALFTNRQSRRHALPELPGYLAGASAGFELEAIR